MRRLAAAATALALGLAAAPPARACMWDYDTLREESLGNRDVLEVVTGQLRHHARAFYLAKIAYTQPMIDGGKAPAERYDDLAVALARTDALDDAIAVLAAKEARFPGLYTTEANLGTFLAMKGDLAGAIDHLQKAVAIDPHAHFGREHFQIELLQWLAQVAKDPSLVDTSDFLGLPFGEEIIGAVDPKHAPKDRAKLAAEAVVAITGIIRFGGGDENEHLWFALGVALGWEGHKNLALRALRRADVLGHPQAAAVGKRLALMDVPVAKIAQRHRAKGAGGGDLESDEQIAWEEAAGEADADWIKGQAVEAAREDAEVLLTAKRPKKAFGY